MTREEAIEILKSIGDKADHTNLNEEEHKAIEAYYMAIQALEQEPCEDCISREDAIKQCGFGMTSLLIADCLRRLPSVTPQPFINKPCVSEGVCREDKIQVLDKIRAELIQSIQNGTLKIESGNEELFRIIDKYKVESEDKE